MIAPLFLYFYSRTSGSKCATVVNYIKYVTLSDSGKEQI